MLGQKRAIIEHITPQINGGKHYIKRVVGEKVTVEADIYGDGHDVVLAELQYKTQKQRKWRSVYFKALWNDRWEAEFTVTEQGLYEYKVVAWIDQSLNWQHNIKRKIEDNQQVNVELLDGVQYIEKALTQCNHEHKARLEDWKYIFGDANRYEDAIATAQSEDLHKVFLEYPAKQFEVESQTLQVYVDRKKALFSAWYEFFPRSSSAEVGKHGTFKDCEKIIPRIADLGFDVLYFPPIHPIGHAHRKGKNNTTEAKAGDVGSPWAIGNQEGGHKSIHSELGSLEDFKDLIQTANAQGIEIAMDYALQCSPDHPYVKEHPQWFKWRPDGTVQYAENPPKKYQDILPINFETEDWKNLWEELLSIVLYWMEQGITIFRVDNPHTKPYYFWEWLIAEVKKKNPDIIFLAEAFTRPRVMHQLAKVGFTQSYTYYTWRDTKADILEYMQELTTEEGKEYFRPNFWVNTPDINPYGLHSGNRNLFLIRYLMASTLTSNYGMYGPVYEKMIHTQFPPKDEYMDSEKYEVKHWQWHFENELTKLIRKVNQARKENPALQNTNNFQACQIDNEAIVAYFKQDESKQNNLIVLVNLDPDNAQQGMVQIPLHLFGKQAGETFKVRDLLTEEVYHWSEEWNFVRLNPQKQVGHLLRVEG